MTIRVVTDSTADLEPSQAAALGITIVPLHVHFGAAEYRDGVDISKATFYERLPVSAVLPRTSQPSPGEFVAAYRSLAAAGATGIVSVHIGGQLSGTVNSARTAAAADAGSVPVEVVDTGQASMALGFAAQAAAEAAAAGGDLTMVAAAARDAAARGSVYLIVDTLEYLQKGGRIGRARAFLGALLRTRPVLELRGGEIQGIERPRTRPTALARLLDLTLRIPQPERIAVIHATTADEAETLAAQIRAARPGVDVTVARASPVIGVHIGPGAVGVCVLRRGNPAP